ncbi:MAG: hypothetical protein II302_03585 [Clostridia bacterium]|nr:hypothetical protein [Clostridia bacterium]
MHFDPYEPKADRKRRIWSNVSLCVIAGLFVLGIIMFMMPNNYGKKYYFEKTETDAYTFVDTVDKTNEFYEMYTEMIVPTNEFEMDTGFSKKFPTAAKLLDMDSSVYNENKPYIYYGGNHVAVAQSFYSTMDNHKTLDVALFGFEPTLDQNKVAISVKEVVRFSLIYNSASGTVNYMKYDPDKFSMQINNFTISVDSGMLKKAGYTFTMKPTQKLKQTDKNLLKNTVIDATNNSTQKPTFTESEDKTVVSLNQEGTEFADHVARYRFDMMGDSIEYFTEFVINAEVQSGTRADDIEYQFSIS